MAAIRRNGRNPRRRPLRGFGTIFITRRMAAPSVFDDPNGPHPEEAAALARPSRRMAPGTGSFPSFETHRYAMLLRMRPVFGPAATCFAGLRSLLKLAFRRELHVGRIEAQLDVLLGAEISGRHSDADGVLRFDVLTEQIVLEAERTDEVHDFRQIGLGGERKGILGGVEHPRGLELGFETGEVGAGRLRHRFACRLALVALVLQECDRFIPDADQRLAEVGVVFERLGGRPNLNLYLAGDLAGVEYECGLRFSLDLHELRIPRND